ncbi:MAG TPA: septation protein A [Burkholderiaceae bacterium]|nr:septation protein A [Pseudomonadota bacterium]MDQ7971521.1 septation protein A [Rhodocyclaceae bacterium]MDQ8001831.1 septation protein A [Pseudomonadota bacterium]MDQ8019433.1 septation protein A [Pseudomonadota bacterium]HZF84988.1 septation protein A [Burkholderiaceae bacterium]
MKLLLDFFPILLFFGAFKLYGIYVATGVLMAGTVVQMAIVYATEKRLQPMQKATLALILIFGTLTLVLHDDRFIKWKPTVLYGAMAVALAVALWAMRKNFLKMLLGSQLQLPERIWNQLNVAWIAYCVFMAAINAYVALYFSTDAWVNFKLWGYVFPIAFLVAQGLYIAPHLKSDESAAK